MHAGRCAFKPLVWDIVAPSVRTWLWHSGREAYVNGAVFTNSSDTISFALAVADSPTLAATGVATVSLAVLPARLDAPPEDTTDFLSLTQKQMSVVATTAGRSFAEAAKFSWFPVHAKLVKAMKHAHTHYLHVYSCDAFNNCAMHVSSAITVDLTPPVAPVASNVYPMKEFLIPPPPTEPPVPGMGSGVVWTSADVIAPQWREGIILGRVNTRPLMAEPESSPVLNQWRVFAYDGPQAPRRPPPAPSPAP